MKNKKPVPVYGLGRPALGAGVLCLALLLSACGGDDNNTTPPTTGGGSGGTTPAACSSAHCAPAP